MPAGTAFSRNNSARWAASLSGSTLSISIRPSYRRIVDLVARLGDLDLQLHAHRSVADALADLIREIIGTSLGKLLLGEILGTALRQHLIADDGAVALGVGEFEAVHAKIGERGKADRRRLFRGQEGLGDRMGSEECLERRRLRRVFAASGEREQEIAELSGSGGGKAVIRVHYQVRIR